MSETLIAWYHAALWIVAVPTTLYPVLYTVWFRWWETSLGRALFTKSAVLAVVIDYTLINSYGHLRNIHFAIGMLFALALAVWYQIIVMAAVKYGSESRKWSIPETDLAPHHREKEAADEPDPT